MHDVIMMTMDIISITSTHVRVNLQKKKQWIPLRKSSSCVNNRIKNNIRNKKNVNVLGWGCNKICHWKVNNKDNKINKKIDIMKLNCYLNIVKTASKYYSSSTTEINSFLACLLAN